MAPRRVTLYSKFAQGWTIFKKTSLFLFLIYASYQGPVLADLTPDDQSADVVAGFDEKQDMPRLNDALRRINRRLLRIEETPTTISLTSDVSGILPLANGGTGAALADPNADKILFWDDSAGQITFLDAPITGTTLAHYQYFSADGTFTAPSGVTRVYLTMLGGGGSGGSGSDGAGGGGGGGGGGSLVNFPYTVVAGNSYTVDVGAGGAAVENGTGNPGSNTTFDTSVIALAGAGGIVGSGSRLGGAGGGGVNGSGSVAGKKGIAGGNGGTGTAGGGGAGGGGGSTLFGVGTAGGPTPSDAAANSGGGGGASDSGSVRSGAGGSGFVIVAY